MHQSNDHNSKTILDTLARIIVFPSGKFSDFMQNILTELVNLTNSKRALIIKCYGQDNLVKIVSGFGFDTDDLPAIENLPGLKSTDAGIWYDSFLNKKEIFLNEPINLTSAGNDFPFEISFRRSLFFPLYVEAQSAMLLILFDKESDYGKSEIDALKLLSAPLKSTIEKFEYIKQLNDSLENETRKSRLKNSYINFISHEIKTPINAITGFSQLLREDNQSPEKCQKFTDIIIESSNNLVSIINSVTEISNIETGLVRILEQEFNLFDVFNDISEQFKDQAKQKKLEFHFDIKDLTGDEVILADKDKLVQVITVLLTNSFQSTFTGRIVFGCSVKNGFIEFFVSDTGTGISEDDKLIMFNLFDNTENFIIKSFKGTGLGLKISKAFIEKMGGKIWYESTEGIGSDFWFTIPYKRSENQLVTKDEHENAEKTSQSRRKSILVAEDDNLNFTLIKTYLSNTDIILTRAENGKAAVDLCNSNHFDLVLMDIRMPEMDGYTAARIIKESYPEQIIIAQTAYTNDRETAIENGCDDFIAKPFGRQQLVSIISNYI